MSLFFSGGGCAGAEREGGIFNGDVFKHILFEWPDDQIGFIRYCFDVAESDVAHLLYRRIINVVTPIRSYQQTLVGINRNIFKQNIVNGSTFADGVARTDTDTDIGIDHFQIGKFAVSDRSAADSDSHAAGG